MLKGPTNLRKYNFLFLSSFLFFYFLFFFYFYSIFSLLFIYFSLSGVHSSVGDISFDIKQMISLIARIFYVKSGVKPGCINTNLNSKIAAPYAHSLTWNLGVVAVTVHIKISWCFWVTPVTLGMSDEPALKI